MDNWTKEEIKKHGKAIRSFLASNDEKHETEFKRIYLNKWLPDGRLKQLRDKAVGRGLRGDEVFEFINLEIFDGLNSLRLQNEKLKIEVDEMRKERGQNPKYAKSPTV